MGWRYGGEEHSMQLLDAFTTPYAHDVIGLLYRLSQSDSDISYLIYSDAEVEWLRLITIRCFEI
jgi:hypothetical protein